MSDVPGDVAYWLRRATREDLVSVRLGEMARHWTAANWRLVCEIDRELYARAAIAKARGETT